jgi:PASTA domain
VWLAGVHWVAMRRAAIWVVLLLVVVCAGSAAAAVNTYWGRGVEAVLPANAATSPGQDVLLQSISCVSAGDCNAVGLYPIGSGASEGLLLTEKAGSWETGVEAVLPANAAATNQGADLASVSCTSVGNCSAVGTYLDSSGAWEGLLLTETAGSWARGVEAVLPANAATTTQHVLLHSVSCGSAGNCSAVGSYVAGSSVEGLSLNETAGSWARGVEAVLPANAVATNQEAYLNSVSCGSAGNCSAVGSYETSTDDREGLLLTETAGTWGTGVEPALPANAATAQQGVLTSVSCASPGNCSAVGSYGHDTSSSDGVLLTETAGSWATGVMATLPANADKTNQAELYLGAVSCPSAANCAAVGDYVDRRGEVQGLLLNEKAGLWSQGVEAALPFNAHKASASEGLDPYAALDAVSCGSVGNCSAAGSYNVYSHALYADTQQGLLLTETAGRWGTGVEAALPSNGTYGANLNSVSCPSADTHCSAAGSYGVSMVSQGLLMGSTATPLCLVPPLKGKTLSAAKRSIKAYACSVGKVEHARSRTVKKGHVISQKPTPGTQLDHEAKINLVVSKGKRP